MRSGVCFMGVALVFGLAGCVPDSGVAPLGIPPNSTSQTDIANYEVAVASIGCNLVSEADYEPVQIQTGLTREQVVSITQYQLQAGKAARIQGGGVQLQTGACKPKNA